MDYFVAIKNQYTDSLYIQPSFCTLIDFCDQSTFTIFSDYVRGFSHVYFQKMGHIFSVVYHM